MCKALALFLLVTAPAETPPGDLRKDAEAPPGSHHQKGDLPPEADAAAVLLPTLSTEISGDSEPPVTSIFNRSVLLGLVLGGAGGWVGFKLGQRGAEAMCPGIENCQAPIVYPTIGMMLGAGFGLVFAPGYVAGQAGYHCDLDKRVWAYTGGAIGGGLLLILGLFGNDGRALVTGLSLPITLPIGACIQTLEPITEGPGGD